MNQEEKAFIIRAYDKAELADYTARGELPRQPCKPCIAGCGETCCYRKN